MKLKMILSLLAFIFLMACSGGGSTSAGIDSDGDTPGTDTDTTINTEKLIGTPFEGQTLGDDFNDNFFYCNEYLTNYISLFPIKIFTAYFTTSEEGIIQEGLDIANEAMGFEAYELTDTWSNDLRVMYKVAEIENAIARTNTYVVNLEGKSFAALVSPDWAIKITGDGINKWTVAHELGHASGIRSHALIDYENDVLADLEDNSLMQATDRIEPPALTDYNFMMQNQGEIIRDHLTEQFSESGECN